ncbi:DUF2278 family protein [Spirosoma agri]|uniref:DUF2278 family protein n=1 Tax=Spirosoma agri TaxID=1987381 RepID=A0A6M0IE84_9BACT|nr:DUF2278 family protein [Spirosoma agri]NEU66137.1 DUF2278 family protein [Spirosoma agri]
MPIANYCVLKGRVKERQRATQQMAHFQILIEDEQGVQYRVAVNAKSQVAPSEVLYFFSDNYSHELIDKITQANLPTGLTTVPSKPNGPALDFVRRNLFDTTQMQPLPLEVLGEDNDLNDKLDLYVKRAINNPDAVLYAFGETWGPETKADQYFHFQPGRGIHDIHMNQGNVGQFVAQDGVWQDGGILIHFASTNRWVALFLAFQSQSFHTDANGHAISDAPGGPVPTPQTADLHLIAALVKPVAGKPERIYMLNASPNDINLAGYSLVDKANRREPLTGTLPAGDVLVYALTGQQVVLSNDGGSISLLDPTGLKVAGVSYTQSQVGQAGKLVVF